MNCLNCGKENSPEVKFCKFCGSSMENEEIKPTPKKSNSVGLLLTYILMFFAIAQAVFIFLLLKDGNAKRTISQTVEESNSGAQVITKEPSYKINAFGGTLLPDSDIKYDFNRGQLLMEKTGVWNAIMVGVSYPYQKYASTKEKLEDEIKTQNYSIKESAEEEINGKNRLVFYTEGATEEITIVYTTMPNKATVLIAFRSEDQERNKENLSEFINILDNAKEFESKISFVRNSLIDKLLNK